MLSVMTTIGNSVGDHAVWQISVTGTEMSESKLLMIGLTVALALTAILTGWLTRRTVKSSRRWPTTTGRIIRADINHHTSGEYPDSYSPVVAYEYTVNGQTYRSERIIWGSVGFENPSEAERFITSYTSDAPLNVYYNPANPRVSVLNPTHEASLKTDLLWHGLWAIFALWVLLTIVAGMS